MDSTALAIIGSMGAAIVGLAGYVKYLVGKVSAGQARIDEIQEARVKENRDHNNTLEGLKDLIKGRTLK